TIRNPIASPAFTTTYFLTVESNGCQSVADEVTVTVNPSPTVHAGSDVTICPGDSTQLNVTIVNALPTTTVFWSPATGLSDVTSISPTASPTTTTTYTVTINSGNCLVSDQVVVTVVPKPTVDAGPNRITCPGFPVTLNGNVISSVTPNAIFWSPSFGIANPNALNTEANLVETMTYYLNVTIGSCLTQDSMVVVVQPGVTANVNASQTIICQGETVVLTTGTGIGSASYTWYPNYNLSSTSGDTVLARPDTTTSYYVIAREGSCVDTAMITIAVNRKPDAEFWFSSARNCGQVTLSIRNRSKDATQGYIWNFGDGTSSNDIHPIHVYDTPGTYSVTLIAIGAGGCRDSATATAIATVTPVMQIDATASVPSGTELIPPASTVQFFDQTVGAVQWFWDFGDSTYSTIQNPSVTYQEPGTYTVKLIVTDAEGCTDTMTVATYTVK
ncbi:MAG: PKD domain-containing protein, partial [Bacteroidia bacterium]|nr:PKD domain-containing protein [Bacteroidia bacterium]